MATISRLMFEGVNGSTTFTDDFGKTWTSVNGASIDHSVALQGNSSGLFASSNQSIKADDHADWAFGTGDFTVEGYVSLSQLNPSGYNTLAGNYIGSVLGHWFFWIEGNNALRFRHADQTGSQASKSLPQNVVLDDMVHFAASRVSGVLRLFWGGVQCGTDQAFTENLSSTKGIWVGDLGNYSGANQGLIGNIDAFEATKGLGKYTTNFTPLYPLALKTLAGTITETLAITDWFVRAYRLDTGALSSSVSTSDGTYSLEIDIGDETEPHIVTATPDQGLPWVATETLILNQLRYPTDPETTPYYYKVTIAGDTGASEPTWVTTPGQTVADGTITWECVERLVRSQSHSPMLPQ